MDPTGTTTEAQDAPPRPPDDPPVEDPLARATEEAQRLRDQLLRTAADFDNFRKRSRREIEDAVRRAREDALRDLLPVFDNLERAAAAAGSASTVESVAEGVQLVLRQFLDTLGRVGVTRIQALGQPFDPTVMEAIQQVETSEHPPGAVAAEVQPGYSMGDRLLRPALVVVAKAPSEN